MGEMLNVMKSLASCIKEAPSIESKTSSSYNSWNLTTEALVALIRKSLNNIEKENFINCFQELTNVIMKYTKT